VRRIPALVSTAALATVLAASLVGCSSGPSTDVDSCTPLYTPGDASSLVEATGEVGSAPKVDFPAPLVSKTPERSVLEEGSGIVATTGMTVDFDASIFDASTGEQLLATKYDGSQGVRYRAGAASSADAEPGSLADALVCAQADQRLAVTSTVLESGLDFSSVGLGDDDSVVFVVDVQAVYLAKADGVNQLPQDGMPNVVTAPDGTPGITLPDGAPPADTRVATIKAGSGEALADGDNAVLNLSIWVWPTDGSDITQPYTSWGKAPVTQPVSEDATGKAGVPAGVYEALVGAKVGSQVLVVVAPEDSFSDGAWPSGTQAGDTLVYVIDVLGIQK
jgi:peptidylprolyl isomerase